MKTLNVFELAAWLADDLRLQPVLLDVREEWEFQAGHIEGAVPMPMNTISDRLSELDRQQPIVCICHHGARSR
jgi:rhodanese-related sulfurtransferase